MDVQVKWTAESGVSDAGVNAGKMPEGMINPAPAHRRDDCCQAEYRSTAVLERSYREPRWSPVLNNHIGVIVTIRRSGAKMSDRIATVFSSVLKLPLDGIGDGLNPENTPQWDSITGVELAMALEEEFRIKLSDEEVMSIQSIAIVRKMLREKGVVGA